MKRTVVFAYGTITLGIFGYAAGLIGNFGVPKAMDSGREVPLIWAIAIDALLLVAVVKDGAIKKRSISQCFMPPVS